MAATSGVRARAIQSLLQGSAMAPRVRKGAVKHARAQQRAPVPRALAAGLEHQVQTYLSWLPSLMSWIFDADGVEPMRCKGKHASGHLSVGSACSGWSSDLMALDMLNISYVSCLAAELDKKVRELGSIMHQHHHVFEDCCSQAFLNSPTCSLFMAGFPCQAWSVAGWRRVPGLSGPWPRHFLAP